MTHASPRAVVALATAALVAAGLLVAPTTTASADTTDPFPGGIAVPTGTTAQYMANHLDSIGDYSGGYTAGVIAAEPTATWLGAWYSQSQLTTVVDSQLANAAKQGKTAVFVTYAIPDRDCSSSYDGGLTASSYAAWNQTLADALYGHHAAVIVEPDALGLLASCAKDIASRENILWNAMRVLGGTGSAIYLDAGNSNWISSDEMIQWLWASGLQFGRGFSSNVSNFYTTGQETAYDQKISLATGQHYVIDVGRNGRGSDGEWCNPWTAALGQNPTVVKNGTGLDALLWIKPPGESDDYCNGGPAAGQWFTAQASRMVWSRP